MSDFAVACDANYVMIIYIESVLLKSCFEGTYLAFHERPVVCEYLTDSRTETTRGDQVLNFQGDLVDCASIETDMTLLIRGSVYAMKDD